MNDEDKKDNEKKVGMVQIESIKDLVHLIVRLPFQIINHMEIGGKHIYFILLGSGIPGFSTTMYYIILDEKIDANYIVFNSIEDKIKYSKTLEDRRGGIIYIPIINIKKQNLIKEEVFEF